MSDKNGKMLGSLPLKSTAPQELLDALAEASASARQHSATPSKRQKNPRSEATEPLESLLRPSNEKDAQ